MSSSKHVSHGKGKLREGLWKVVADDRKRQAEVIRKLPEFAAGTLTRDQVGVIWGTSAYLNEYTKIFFKTFGYTFPGDTFEMSCGHCLYRAMGYEDGYISEPDLADACDAREKKLAKRQSKIRL